METQVVSRKSGDVDAVKEEESCSECSGGIISTGNGERVCENCGLVVDDVGLDRGPDWRSFSDDLKRQNPRRVGAPLTELEHDRGLSTDMGSLHRDGNGNTISQDRKKQLRRMRKWDNRYKVDSSERGLRFALAEIKRMGSALGIPRETREMAAVLYRRCLSENLIVGYSIEGVATACVYVAARQSGRPRTLKEVFRVCRLSGKDKTHNIPHVTVVGRVYRHIVDELSITLEPVDPEKYLDRFISEVGFENPMKIRSDAENFIEAVRAENKHSGVNPSTLAATAVYCASGINDSYCTQRKMVSIAGIAVETLRSRYKDFCEVVGVEPKALKYSGDVSVPQFE